MTHVTVRIQLDTDTPPDQAGASVLIHDQFGYSYSAGVTHDEQSDVWITADENASASHPTFVEAFDTLMAWTGVALRDDLEPR